MGTVQLNISRRVDYSKNINHGRFLNSFDDDVFFEGKKILSLSDYNTSASDFLKYSRYNHVYSHYGVLEHFFMVNKLGRIMSFENYKMAFINQFREQQHPWFETHRIIINKMLVSSAYKIRYYRYTECKEKIIDTLTNGIPFVLNVVVDMEGVSKFYNSLLVYGVVRDEDGAICGITCMDYAGDANSNYVNKNGNQVTYHGKLFSNIIDRSLAESEVATVVGIASEQESLQDKI